jgi:hypothetical protein
MGAEPIEKGGKPLTCRHCGGDLFDRHAVRLNAIVDWSDYSDDDPPEGEIVACARCGLSELFLDFGDDESTTCLSCGAAIPVGREQCSVCGWTYHDGVDPLEVAPRSRAPIPDDACLSCGERIPLESDTCPACGWSYGTDVAAVEVEIEAEVLGDLDDTAAVELPPPPGDPERASDRSPKTAVPPPLPRCPHCDAPRRSGAQICSSSGRIYEDRS